MGGASTTCGQTEGQAILDDGGFTGTQVVLVDGCTYSDSGARSGEIRTAIARVGADQISDVLEGAQVDVQSASSSRFDAESPELGGVYKKAGHPLSFDVMLTADGQPWQEGERLTIRDAVDGDGQRVERGEGKWDRYVAWGREQNGDDYLVMVRLENGRCERNGTGRHGYERRRWNSLHYNRRGSCHWIRHRPRRASGLRTAGEIGRTPIPGHQPIRVRAAVIRI